MNSLLRLEKAFSLEKPDRPPILGGWLAAPNIIINLTGCSESDYWDDPYYWGAQAENKLGSDGIFDIFKPIRRGEYRIVDHNYPQQQHSTSINDFLDWINIQPSVDEIREKFDTETFYQLLKNQVNKAKSLMTEAVWVAKDWEIVPNVLGRWSFHYGIETTMMTIALHPECFRKLIINSAEIGRQKAEVLARAVKDGLIPPAVLSGEDLCSQQGPMVSPKYLRKEYWPLVEYSLEPLFEADVKVVWHSDGNWQKLLPDVLACGINGLQGFQDECEMSLDWVCSHKTKEGNPLLIFGPISVTGIFRHGTPGDIQNEVIRIMKTCRDKASLVFFTSNTITPDIPSENVVALWDSVLASRW